MGNIEKITFLVSTGVKTIQTLIIKEDLIMEVIISIAVLIFLIVVL